MTEEQKIERVYHKDGSQPKDGRVFVFGSNLGGHHSKGAALAAKQHFGARRSVPNGYSGMSYAIPTKDQNIRTLKLSDIRLFIAEFVAFTKANPNMRFFVTRVGCVLARFNDGEIAPLFKEAINCSFAESWKPYLEK